jgi:hypothetical protein
MITHRLVIRSTRNSGVDVARKVVVQMADDLDGSPATQTIRFGFQGVEYELDLNDENAAEMTHWLENYISHARRVGGRKRDLTGKARVGSGVDAKAVRQWANEQGLEISARGRIPSQLVQQYLTSVGE